jgi:hypothetical protein
VLNDPAAHAAARVRSQRFNVESSAARFAESLERAKR